MLIFQEDVAKCEADGCKKQPAFGFPGERPRRCKAHMLEGMVRMLAQGHRSQNMQLLTCAALV